MSAYAPGVSSGRWVGAVTGLGGAAIGGAISLAVTRQQIRDAKDQRKERAEQAKRERSLVGQQHFGIGVAA
jgi:hypothetical protein